MFNNLRSWANCFPQQPHHFTFPPAWHKESYFSTFLSALIIFSPYIGAVCVCVCVCVCVWDNSYPGWEVVSQCGLDFLFPKDQWYWESFYVFIGHLYIFFRVMLTQVLLLILPLYCLLFCHWVIQVLYICVHAQSLIFNSLWPWTVDCQAPLSMGFSRQEIKECDLCSYSLGRHKGLRT